MLKPLTAWLSAAAKTEDPERAAAAAAESLAGDPWEIVQQAGQLARCQMVAASQDLGLTCTLAVRPVDHPATISVVPKGAPYPAHDRTGRRKRGAYDTPTDMARATVTAALQANTRTPHMAIDPACGTGAFLVALAEQVQCRIMGVELDPVAAAVARIAVPRAEVIVGDGFTTDYEADILVGNPPFVPPERQDKKLRDHLRATMPWLKGRFDLSVPFAAAAVERVRKGGGIAMILPAPLMVQPYATPLRRAWLEQHAITHLSPSPFPGAQVGIVCIAMTADAGPAPFPNHGLSPQDLGTLEAVPFHPALQPGDPTLVGMVRAASIPLGEIATVDTGVVSHGSLGGKDALLHATPTPDRVPYVDAIDLAENRTRWLDYQPEHMHRAKSPALFESPKVLVQRLRGRGPIRAWVDHSGLYAGHTLTVVRPDDATLSPEQLHTLITHPMVDGLLRMERGPRLDLYPKDVRSIPIPQAWLTHPEIGLTEAWGLDRAQADRLIAFSIE